MKREACQHGMLRAYQVLPPPWKPETETKAVQRRLYSSPAAGLFSDVMSKWSNSKFAVKCGRPHCLECHLNPVSKSKDKTKGTQKFRTRNMVVSPRLITWRVVDRRPGLKFSGFSATEILEHLYSGNEDDEIGDHESDDHGDCDDDDGPRGLLDDDDYMAKFWSLHDKENERGAGVETEEWVDDEHKMDNDDISFCDVGLMLDQNEEDEGWCFLREM